MIQLIRTDAHNVAFVTLVSKLDAELGERDGDDHAFYHQFNSIDTIRYAVVAYINDIAVGCGAIKEFDANCMEVKRMYVAPGSRGKGIGTKVLQELEKWAAQLDYTHCVLETGKKQPEAIAMYNKNGYEVVPNYGQYVGVENSVCFKKNVSF